MAMQKILTPGKRAEFEKLVRITRNIDEKDRLRAILAYDEGHDVRDIADILKISDSTTYNYINDYLTQNKIAHSPRGGSDSKLAVSQEIELISHLRSTTYLTAKSICLYIFNKYQVKYTVSGLTKWLERNAFVYKAPKLIPGKLDEDKQQSFIEYYQNLTANASANDLIMFMDAVHPEYQSQSVCGWMPKGETKTLATTNTQYRLHLNGAIDLTSMQIITREYETINAQSIISFCKDLEKTYPDKSIHLICDNGRSNKNKELTKYLETSRVVIHYLPPYSPNLNPIERLWKIMREHVSYNKIYPKFAKFTTAVRQFFASTVPSIQDILRVRINDNFEVIRHNPVQLSS
jgi:transposase